MKGYKQLLEELEKDEKVEAIIFGKWGWDGYDEPEPHPLNHKLIGKVLTLEKAKPILEKVDLYCGYGAPKTYAMRVFTNKRILWITQYDGSTSIDSTIINPFEGYVPDMPGG